MFVLRYRNFIFAGFDPTGDPIWYSFPPAFPEPILVYPQRSQIPIDVLRQLVPPDVFEQLEIYTLLELQSWWDAEQ